MRPFLIITLSDTKKVIPYDIDIEVPTDVPASRLTADVLEVLKAYYPGAEAKMKKRQLYSKRLNRMLQGNETFGDVGIRMGDIILMK